MILRHWHAGIAPDIRFSGFVGLVGMVLGFLSIGSLFLTVLCVFSDNAWVFFFEVRFYPPEPSELIEDITRCGLCLSCYEIL